MIQRVPSWDIDDPPNPSHNLYPSSSSAAAPPQLSMTNTFRASCHRSDYEVAELTWQNGHLSAHGLVKPTTPRQAAGGTLESIVNQAKLLHPSSATWHHPGGPHLTAALDARVPTTGHHRPGQVGVEVDLASGIGSCGVSRDRGGGKPARPGETAGPVGSMDSTRVVVDETDDLGFATTNSVTPLPDEGNVVSGSPDTENTSFGDGGGSRPLTVADDHDSVCHIHRSLSQREMAGEEDEKIMEGDNMRSTVSTRRSRAAVVHNQSERKRRDKINQKIRTLQKLVPNSNKTDKASMLDEVIEYLKQLQAQVQMMSRMSSIPSMMMPVNMQQLQMTMMAKMAQMGMGMGMMDMASLGRTGPVSISPVMPAGSFLPMIGAAGAWDPSAAAAAAAERIQQPAGGGVMPDPFSAFVVCQPQQQMTMDACPRMVALYQQTFQQNQPANPK